MTSSNGVIDVGLLTVTGLSSTTKVTVSADAWGAGFGGTATLLYLTGPTPSTDANSTSVYGTWALGGSRGRARGSICRRAWRAGPYHAADRRLDDVLGRVHAVGDDIEAPSS